MRSILLILLFPVLLSAQNTSIAISDSIKAKLSAHVIAGTILHDTLLNPMYAFRTQAGDMYTYILQVAGAQFRAVSNTVEPDVFRFNDNTLTRCWHEYEMDNWLFGMTGTNYEGYSITGAVTISCVITISGDTWEGFALNGTDAFGRALLLFLYDANISNYLQ